jgi:hypothetical protein
MSLLNHTCHEGRATPERKRPRRQAETGRPNVSWRPATGSHATVESYLAIYLNDQLALGVLWRELARRAQRNNHDSEIGTALTEVATGISEDVDTFKTIMSRLGVRRNSAKIALAFGAERLVSRVVSDFTMAG